ncbi:MAG: hypothetical protein L6V80_06490 [Bacteroidales bacterium]|nr:MAG: hypothetical protein L6V80_06490 [Bacteroidales bacterium]
MKSTSMPSKNDSNCLRVATVTFTSGYAALKARNVCASITTSPMAERRMATIW